MALTSQTSRQTFVERCWPSISQYTDPGLHTQNFPEFQIASNCFVASRQNLQYMPYTSNSRRCRPSAQPSCVDNWQPNTEIYTSSWRLVQDSSSSKGLLCTFPSEFCRNTRNARGREEEMGKSEVSQTSLRLATQWRKGEGMHTAMSMSAMLYAS